MVETEYTRKKGRYPCGNKDRPSEKGQLSKGSGINKIRENRQKDKREKQYELENDEVFSPFAPGQFILLCQSLHSQP